MRDFASTRSSATFQNPFEAVPWKRTSQVGERRSLERSPLKIRFLTPYSHRDVSQAPDAKMDRVRQGWLRVRNETYPPNTDLDEMMRHFSCTTDPTP